MVLARDRHSRLPGTGTLDYGEAIFISDSGIEDVRWVPPRLLQGLACAFPWARGPSWVSSEKSSTLGTLG